MSDIEYHILLEALRVVFLITVPIVVAGAIAGLLAGLLQTATAISDTSIGYTARLLAVVVVCYLLLSTALELLLDLARLAFS